MKKKKVPQTDSIQELASFWDTHDVIDFEDELEEIAEPIFERDAVIEIRLPCAEAERLDELAESKGVDRAALVREWVLKKVQRS